jgi:hypothetical protein
MEFFFGAFEKEWERRRAAILHDRARGNGSQSDDEPRKRRGTVAVSPGGSFGRIAGRKPRSVQGKRTSSTEPSMRSRFRALASGSQPAVVKLASFGSGARLGAMINYVSRNGEVAVENERGQELRGRDEISMIRGEWNHLMKNRAESRDIGTFAVDISGGFDPGGGLRAQARALLKSGLGDRRFAFAIKGRENGYTIEGVTVCAIATENGSPQTTKPRGLSQIASTPLSRTRYGSGLPLTATAPTMARAGCVAWSIGTTERSRTKQAERLATRSWRVISFSLSGAASFTVAGLVTSCI